MMLLITPWVRGIVLASGEAHFPLSHYLVSSE